MLVLLVLGLVLWGSGLQPLTGKPGTLVARAAPPPAEEKTDEPEPPLEKVSLVLDTGGHTAEVVHVAFTPDDRELMTVSRDGTVRFWDVETGETVQVLRPPVPQLNVGAALAPDGRRVAVSCATAKGWLTLILTRDGNHIRTFHEPAGVMGLAFSPDGKWLASVGHSNAPGAKALGKKVDSVRLWDLERGELAPRPPEAAGVNYSVAFAPDGKRLATGTDTGECGIWSREPLKRLDPIDQLPKIVQGVAWSPDGQQVATEAMNQQSRTIAWSESLNLHESARLAVPIAAWR